MYFLSLLQFRSIFAIQSKFKTIMHPKNNHTTYNFDDLILSHSSLAKFVFVNEHGTKTIDFSKNDAVFHLNKAILKANYNITDWRIPKGYLCPPIPGRADYIHHISDLLNEDSSKTDIKGLDVGVGANCIYSILGSQIYNWKMIGCDINLDAINAAQHNVNLTEALKKNIEIRHQKDNANIFKGIIKEDEYFDFTMCNPPFHTSEAEASKGTMRKLSNLRKDGATGLNFGGQANELWCNGGEVLFIKRMIKQSVAFKTQVGWFTTLVSKKENLPKIYKQLDKLKATHKTISMKQGNKQSRFIAWNFKTN